MWRNVKCQQGHEGLIRFISYCYNPVICPVSRVCAAIILWRDSNLPKNNTKAMELRDTPPHTPIPNQNGFAFNRDEGEVSSKRLINKGPQEERKSPGVKRTVVKLILENFQSAFNKKISQSFVDNIQLQPSSLLWRYFLLDYIICNFFIAPAVIAFWRGTWDYSLVWIKGIEYFNVSSHKLFKTFCLQTYLLFLLLLLFQKGSFI